MRVVHVSSEIAPFAQSGGLADVLAGLPPALADMHGLDVAVVAPLYRGVDTKLATAGIVLDSGAPITVSVGPHHMAGALRRARLGRVMVGFVDLPALYDRAGSLYGPGGPAEFPDNHVRFAALGKVAVEHGAALVGGSIDVLHVHDWQGASAALYAQLRETRPAVALTIHNLAYRGIFPKAAMDELGLPWSMFDVHHVEFWDQVCLLKGAMACADAVTTVSPSYAREILTPERGEALDAFLRWDVKRLSGIVNGIDTTAWDPATDPALPAHFSRADMAGKQACRRALAEELGLPLADDEPLIGVIARMTDQKGLDLVADVVPELHRLRAKLVVLGSGDPHLEARFRYLAETFSDHVAVHVGFDIGLSRRIYAGSDLFVMPSRFEPCGLGQLYAMRYGALPVVHAVGGLRDTVLDGVTGIRFETPTHGALLGALERAAHVFRDPATLARLRDQAMARDSSWTASAHEYVQLYRSLR